MENGAITAPNPQVKTYAIDYTTTNTNNSLQKSYRHSDTWDSRLTIKGFHHILGCDSSMLLWDIPAWDRVGISPCT
jgi:hypothetical protein